LQRHTKKDVDARHKAGHDGMSERRLRTSRRARLNLEHLHRYWPAAKKTLPQLALN
jgi:hypothetical protein